MGWLQIFTVSVLIVMLTACGKTVQLGARLYGNGSGYEKPEIKPSDETVPAGSSDISKVEAPESGAYAGVEATPSPTPSPSPVAEK